MIKTMGIFCGSNAVRDGFIRPSHRGLVLAANTLEALIEQFTRYRPPAGNGQEQNPTPAST